jgi:hypothetical protein
VIFQFCPSGQRKVGDFPILPSLVEKNQIMQYCWFGHRENPVIGALISLDRENPIEKTYRLGIFAYDRVYT